jgi:hypothetical protein
MSKKRITVPVGTPKIKKFYGNERVEIVDRVILYVESSLESILGGIQAWQAQYGIEYTDLKFDSEVDCNCPYDCSCGPTTYLWGTREETDLEYNFRLGESARVKQVREASERKQFEELSKKYGAGQ